MSRTLKFGYIEPPTRYNNALIPIRSSRSLLAAMRAVQFDGPPSNLQGEEETFINEKEAVAELAANGQAGTGIIDVITQGAKALSGFVPVDAVSGLANIAGKATKALAVAKKTGKLIGDLAFGEIGTTISNRLSEKFNKNPEWRPGFPGEKHVVLNTPHGLTRANFCGPGTQIIKRSNRGDKGVNQIDTACQKHDLLYHFARTKEDIRRADREMIREVDAVTDSGPTQKALAKGLIRGKIIGEDIGVFGPQTFTDLPGLDASRPSLEGEGIADRMDGVQRHMGQILARVMNLPHQSIQSRFGGNGISRGQIISGNDTMRHPVVSIDQQTGIGIRRTGLLGNVKGRDPTISGMNTSFISGTGNNALVQLLRSKGDRRSFGANTLSGNGRNRNSISGMGLLPEEARDLSRKKFLDPTIRGEISSQSILGIGGNSFDLAGEGGRFSQGPFHKANPRGTGIIDDIATAAGDLKNIGILPGNILKKNVLKGLKKSRKLLARKIKADKRSVLSKRKGQTGGQLPALAGLAASFIIPEVIKLIRKGKKGKGLSLPGAGINGNLGKGFFSDIGKFLKTAGKEVDRTYIHPPGKKQTVAEFNAANRKKGKGRYVGQNNQVGFRSKPKRRKQRGKGSGRMVYDIHKKTFYPYELRKISSGASGKGKGKKGAGPKTDLVIKLVKQHGLLPMSLSSNALIPLIQAAVKKRKVSKKKQSTLANGNSQEGGQLGSLAALAASLIIPKIIKSIRKR
jgi:hypothetical protein